IAPPGFTTRTDSLIQRRHQSRYLFVDRRSDKPLLYSLPILNGGSANIMLSESEGNARSRSRQSALRSTPWGVTRLGCMFNPKKSMGRIRSVSAGETSRRTKCEERFSAGLQLQPFLRKIDRICAVSGYFLSENSCRRFG